MSDNHLLAQGQAKPATEEDLFRDASGITYPNLHRRIDTDLTQADIEVQLCSVEGDLLINTEGNSQLLATVSEIRPGSEEYILSVSGFNSYRTTKKNTYTEDNTDEIP